MESYLVTQKIVKTFNECESLEDKAQFLQGVIKKCVGMLESIKKKNSLPFVEVIENNEEEINVENNV